MANGPKKREAPLPESAPKWGTMKGEDHGIGLGRAPELPPGGDHAPVPMPTPPEYGVTPPKGGGIDYSRPDRAGGPSRRSVSLEPLPPGPGPTSGTGAAFSDDEKQFQQYRDAHKAVGCRPVPLTVRPAKPGRPSAAAKAVDEVGAKLRGAEPDSTKPRNRTKRDPNYWKEVLIHAREAEETQETIWGQFGRPAKGGGLDK